MDELMDKIIIFIICTAFYISYTSFSPAIVPILVAVIISALSSYYENEIIKIAGFAILVVLSVINDGFMFFMPLVCYDVLFTKFKWLWLFSLLAIAVNFKETFTINTILIMLFIILAGLLKYRTISLHSIKKEYYKLRDSSMEMSMVFERKNKELMEKQDYEINLATLNERNRIARDIHDNVGHLLSSSILQVGALLVTSKDEKTKESLRLLKDTLSKAMDSIRNSVHNLHDESIDLYTEIRTLINNFRFCPVEFEYDIDSNIEHKLKYCFIAVIKECLSNIARHSNATKASIVLREHPAIYQLIVQDNGTCINYEENKGIGLKNISDRVASFNGNMNLSKEEKRKNEIKMQYQKLSTIKAC